MKKFFTILNAVRSAFDKAGVQPPDLGDFLLDKLEEFVVRTDNKIDDAIILPVIKGLRVIWDIPDEDEEEAKLEVVK